MNDNTQQSPNTPKDNVSLYARLKEKAKIRFLSDKARFLTAIALIILLVLVLSIDSPLLTCIVLAFLCVIAMQEVLSLYKLESALHYYIATILAWLCAYFNDRVIESALFVLILYASYLAYSKKITLKTLLPFIYPLLPFLSIYALYKDAGGAGVWVIVWLIVIVAFTDTGAYFGGKAFGKTPFCPTSPKKTLEGVICGVIFGVAFGSIVGIGTCGNFLYSLGITFVVALSAVFGDLFESYLKREAGVKDSGSLLPGHGGVLDRLDAILFGAVVMHFLLFFLPGYNNITIML
ncbi:CDP-archaeol synthase [Helicobacter mastomyrinus]|uniref:Phosphatidate cytidylyltransferase n=1 Tax=Helicobacter mastomyrinus TaxID=287948 RepID=A0ABZ3F7G3_9HELI